MGVGRSAGRGEWLGLPPAHQDTWLAVAQNSWYHATRDTPTRDAVRREVGGVVHLDGAAITTNTAFYCALGEAVHGPGGHCGASLDALAECLSDGSAPPPAEIVWREFAASRASLDGIYLELILEALRESGVAVTLVDRYGVARATGRARAPRPRRDCASNRPAARRRRPGRPGA
ncbi:barstar family protein [Saccharothrix espanaensis]|uniref:barstar family protein n=1 Tax=Saccharothrix espanaensis TaxID=103731 RepID=UPI0026913DF0